LSGQPGFRYVRDYLRRIESSDSGRRDRFAGTQTRSLPYIAFPLLGSPYRHAELSAGPPTVTGRSAGEVVFKDRAQLRYLFRMC
jgi:hypothetical protein